MDGVKNVNLAACRTGHRPFSPPQTDRSECLKDNEAVGEIMVENETRMHAFKLPELCTAPYSPMYTVMHDHDVYR